jgi:lipopolysaccharide transport system permease protein
VWSYVQAALTMGAAAFLTNTTLVVRTSAPRVAFPISALLATAPTLGLTLLTTVALSAAAGQLGPRALLLPAALVWLVALVGALVLLASTLAVWFRDVLQALPFALQVGVFLAPVGYPLGRLSGTLAAVLRLDPLTGLIELVRWSLLSSQPLDGAAVAIGLGVTAMLLVAGWQLFVRAEVRMADVI